MTDSSGSKVEEIHYLPFGSTLSDTGSVSVNHKFTSQELDAETDLYYYGARYYNPVLGRFISPDSIVPDPADPQAFNRYSYALNNPLIYTDPTGNAPSLDFYTIFEYSSGGSSWDVSSSGPFWYDPWWSTPSWSGGNDSGGSGGSGSGASGSTGSSSPVVSQGTGACTTCNAAEVNYYADGYMQNSLGQDLVSAVNNYYAGTIRPYLEARAKDNIGSGNNLAGFVDVFGIVTIDFFMPRYAEEVPLMFMGGGVGKSGGWASSTLLRKLKPEGKLIGTAYNKWGTHRTLPGDLREAGRFFRELTVDGTRVSVPGYKGTVMQLPDGGRVGFRAPRNATHSGLPTIEVMRGANINEIEKFKFK